MYKSSKMTGEKLSEIDTTTKLAEFGQLLYKAKHAGAHKPKHRADQAAGAHKPKHRADQAAGAQKPKRRADQAAGAQKPKRPKKSDPNQPKKPKEIKDPRAPKSIMNAFILYCKLQREAFKNESQQPSQEDLGISWNAFTVSQKAVFTTKVEKYKEQYKTALSTYVDSGYHEAWIKKDDEAKKDYILKFNRDQAATGVAANAQGANQDLSSGKYAYIEICSYEGAPSKQPTQPGQAPATPGSRVEDTDNKLEQAEQAKKLADTGVENGKKRVFHARQQLQKAQDELMQAFEHLERTHACLQQAKAAAQEAVEKKEAEQEAAKKEGSRTRGSQKEGSRTRGSQKGGGRKTRNACVKENDRRCNNQTCKIGEVSEY